MRASLVLRQDGGVSSHLVDGGISAGERLDIYRNTFASALTRALRLSYPAVHRLVGAAFFEGAARIFIEGSPPKGACLDDYGERFAAFLFDLGPAASLPYLPDVARLEWAVNRALHADDAEPLNANRLASLSQPKRAHLRFTPHPSVRLVRVDYPADLIWRAVLEQDDAALAAVDLAAGPVWLLVERLAGGIDVRRMSESEWRFTAALFAGRPLHQALEEAPCTGAEVLLAEHLAAGRFGGLDLGDCLVTTRRFQ